jgi:hypothetical protein
MKTKKQIKERLNNLRSNNESVLNIQGKYLNNSAIDELNFILNLFNLNEYRDLSETDKLYKVRDILKIHQEKYRYSKDDKYLSRKSAVVDWCLGSRF